jgi:hypothetical protein
MHYDIICRSVGIAGQLLNAGLEDASRDPSPTGMHQTDPPSWRVGEKDGDAVRYGHGQEHPGGIRHVSVESVSDQEAVRELVVIDRDR